MTFLLELHPLISFLIICSIAVTISVSGLYLVRRRYGHEAMQENHEVAAIIFNGFIHIFFRDKENTASKLNDRSPGNNFKLNTLPCFHIGPSVYRDKFSQQRPYEIGDGIHETLNR